MSERVCRNCGTAEGVVHPYTCPGEEMVSDRWVNPVCPEAVSEDDVRWAVERIQGGSPEVQRKILGDSAVERAFADLTYEEFPSDPGEARRWLSEKMRAAGDALWDKMQEKLNARREG